MSAIRQAFATSGLPETGRLLVSGPGVFAVESRATIERDSWRLSSIAGGLVLGLLFLVYRSTSPVLLSLLPVLTGVLVGISVVQLVFGFVHGITLGFGATLIGEAVDYPAYLLTHVAAGERLQETLTRIWPTLRLAVMTTVFGGLTMLLSSFTGLSQLGVLSVVGVFVRRIRDSVDPAGARLPAGQDAAASNPALELEPAAAGVASCRMDSLGTGHWGSGRAGHSLPEYLG